MRLQSGGKEEGRREGLALSLIHIYRPPLYSLSHSPPPHHTHMHAHTHAHTACEREIAHAIAMHCPVWLS